MSQLLNKYTITFPDPDHTTNIIGTFEDLVEEVREFLDHHCRHPWTPWYTEITDETGRDIQWEVWEEV